MLEIQNLSVSYGSLSIVSEVSFDLNAGDWLMLAGPNGAGKSTILGAIGGSVPARGEILFENRSIPAMKGRERAAILGTLRQNHLVSYGFTVSQVVGLGRYAYGRNDVGGQAAIEEAIRQVGLWEKRNQTVTTLSGGELQRAFLAQLLCQNPKILLLDEPANHLDLVYQKHIFSLIQEWLKQPGRAVVSVVHDLSLARRYGTHAVLMHHGKSIAQGVINDVLTPENLKNVYDMDVFDWMHEMLSQWQ